MNELIANVILCGLALFNVVVLWAVCYDPLEGDWR